ncbi:MAG: IS110 family transposase [Planctomycetota bacterium]
MSQISAYIGLDVHKNSISIAAAPAEHSNPVQFHGRHCADTARLIKKLAAFGAPAEVRICYEAGPTGYGLARALIAAGYDCQVVAPAKTPKLPSDRVKTDRRDAKKLAEFLRSGHLTAIRIPTEEEEALRDLIRAREDVKHDESDLKRRLMGLMLRRGRVWNEKSNWTKAHMAWLERAEFDHAATNETKIAYLELIKHLGRVLAELDRRIEHFALSMQRADLVRALCAFKGIRVLTAATIISEIGDFDRFPTAAQFMSFLGLTPSESSSGDSTKRGPITKAGNKRLRRLLVESAWTYKKTPHESLDLKRRSRGVHPSVKDIAMAAQKRLWRRQMRLLHLNKCSRKVNVAVARELAGFLWAAGRSTQLLTQEA